MNDLFGTRTILFKAGGKQVEEDLLITHLKGLINSLKKWLKDKQNVFNITPLVAGA